MKFKIYWNSINIWRSIVKSYENEMRIFRVEMFMIIIDDDILNFVEVDVEILFECDVDINIVISFIFIY